MYRFSVLSTCPPPEADIWVSFGYCVCRTKHEEEQLANAYRQLVCQCSFQQICQAFSSDGLLSLMLKTSSSNGLHSQIWEIISVNVSEETIAGITDILTTDLFHTKSVWYLKQCVCSEHGFVDGSLSHFEVINDYGFGDCSEEERQQLMQLYKFYLDLKRSNPLELHEAFLSGQTYEYLTQFLRIPPKFRAKMRTVVANAMADAKHREQRFIDLHSDVEHTPAFATSLCVECGKHGAAVKCPKCRVAVYCNKKCLKAHRKHRKSGECAALLNAHTKCQTRHAALRVAAAMATQTLNVVDFCESSQQRVIKTYSRPMSSPIGEVHESFRQTASTSPPVGKIRDSSQHMAVRWEGKGCKNVSITSEEAVRIVEAESRPIVTSLIGVELAVRQDAPGTCACQPVTFLFIDPANNSFAPARWLRQPGPCTVVAVGS